MGNRVDEPLADQKLPPGVIAVTRNQGFIQVKYRQRQSRVSLHCAIAGSQFSRETWCSRQGNSAQLIAQRVEIQTQ